MAALFSEGLMPQGFFANSHEVYAEIASYPVVPPEKIKQYWNVYTTTFRRRFDPSAYRLENFWWHVWGSDKRNLSGPALARLFEELSNGPTYALLWSPVEPGQHPKTRGSSDSSGQDAAPIKSKPPTPSSSRPPPPHPILKKSRTPSTSTRRPTARFASPPESSDKGNTGHGVASLEPAQTSSEMPPPPLPSLARKQPVTAAEAPTTEPTATTEMTPTAGTTPETETNPPAELVSTPDPAVHLQLPKNSFFRGAKGTTITTRRLVVTTASSRRKPVIVRRRSSQSSTGSIADTRAAGAGSTTATKHARSRRAPLTAAQLLGQGSVSPHATEPVLREPVVSELVVSEPVVSEPVMSEPVLSAKAAGKRPARRTMSPSVVARSVRDSTTLPGLSQSRQEAAGQAPQAPPRIAGFVGDLRLGSRAPSMVRSRSNNTEGLHRRREPGLALLPSQATSSVATYITTARGQFDTETFTADSIIPEARDIPDSVLFGSQPSSSPLLEPHFTPTPPNLAPPILFGRSKSELTLLLERERERERASEES
ncbi:hypothetical protein BT67DRAFT_452677 [Trichocladium antarcticum]|uniref:Nitrogen regulatory protein areA GATA-like domain-containing protein n=1 Tax=Trichocladium antarcticum TaxID=1450529 RepID=A0AAN6UBW6_9PEZI|nr:hypothetical protein BT67DRAFT_452677 [Trichocladium antarcticum]